MIGVSFLVDLAANIGGPRFSHDIERARMARWHQLEPEYFLLDHLVDASRCAIDVGANKGIYAGRLSKLCHRVHCFEPNPELAEGLKKCMHDNVRVHAIAASDYNGQGELLIPSRNGHPIHQLGTLENEKKREKNTNFDAILCQVGRLDDIIDEPVGFIKIDAEGHELAVLRGAQRLLGRDHPVLLVEAERRHNAAAPENVFEYLLTLGYVGLYLEHERLRPLSTFSVERCQNLDGLSKATCRNSLYINNFIFIPG